MLESIARFFVKQNSLLHRLLEPVQLNFKNKFYKIHIVSNMCTI
jgi:hypothetical protein